MNVIQSWEDHNNNFYAVVKHSKADQQKYRTKEYEAMYMIDGQLNAFGGSVGYRIADFDTALGAEEFLRAGISLEDEFPDIWLEMVQV